MHKFLVIPPTPLSLDGDHFLQLSPLLVLAQSLFLVYLVALLLRERSHLRSKPLILGGDIGISYVPVSLICFKNREFILIHKMAKRDKSK